MKWVSVALLVVVVFGCGGPRQAADSGGPIRVVATTTIVADLVRVVGGADVEVEALMGAGVDPHLYKPSAGDVRRMSSANAVFYNGLHLEGKMSELLGEIGSRGVNTTAVTSCAPEESLISSSGFSALHDPHVWFDVTLWIDAVRCTSSALAELDPGHAEAFAKREADYIVELSALDAWVRARVAEVPEERRVLVTAHDAFSYFGRAYGFTVKGLLGVSTAAEAGTSDVSELADFIAEQKIPAIFVETSVSPRFLQALQEAVAARHFDVKIGGSLYSDALGNPGSPAATYVGTVRANVNTIVTALLR